MSGFSFNQPTSGSSIFGGSGETNKSIFGTPGGSSTTSGAGNGSGSIGSGSGFNFGAPASGGTSLFGNTPNTFATSNSSGTPSLTAPNPPANLFGQPALGGASSTPTATTPAAPSSGLFGFGKPADPNAAKPSAPGAPTPSTPNGPAASGTSLFSGLSKPSESVASGTVTTTPGGSIFGGANLFGKKPEASQLTGATPTSTATPAPGSTGTTFSLGINKDASGSTGFSLGGSKDASKDSISAGTVFGGASIANKTNNPPSSTPGLFGASNNASSITTPNLFGAKDSSSNTGPTLPGSKDSATVSTTPSLFGAKDTAKPDSSSTSLLSSKLPAAGTQSAAGTAGTMALKDGTTAIAVPPPSVLKGKSVEEIVSKWSADLDNHVKEFNKFAGEVAVWDRTLMENGNNLATLYGHVLNVEREQTDIEQSLDHIEQQQKDLLATLSAYEGSINEVLGGQGGSLRTLDTGPADTERDKNFMLATELHGHLDDLSSSLTQMIDSVNSLSMGSGSVNGLSSSQASVDDSMTQISQILSNHLESLQWIDGAVREVEGKVTEVERRIGDLGGANGFSSSQTKSRGPGFAR